ncbi:MAG TPA: methyltransferase domain-containing protein [Dehalococcoidia bacterium]
MGDPLRRWYATSYFGADYFLMHPEPPPEETLGEVDRIVAVLGLEPPARLLDFGCGWGRHAIELARRGYWVTGQDLSETFLAMARERASREGLPITWVHADMREVPFTDAFDAAISINSVLGVLEGDEEDARAVAAVARSLRPGGRLLVDQTNREHVIRHYRPDHFRETEDGHLVIFQGRLDLRESLNHVTVTIIGPEGGRRTYRHVFRLYTLTELARMLERAGLRLEEVWGGLDRRPYDLESPRMVLLARREG